MVDIFFLVKVQLCVFMFYLPCSECHRDQDSTLVVDGEYQTLGFAFFTIFPDILFGSQIKSADNRILQEQLESKVSCPLLPTLRPVTTHQVSDVETHAPSMLCGCYTDCRDQ
jgi:hypothetical protein